MPDFREWYLDLAGMAPAADRPMLRVIATLLAMEADAGALLIIADALDEAAAELSLNDRKREAAGLRSVAHSVRGDVETRRSRRGNFW